jgi:ubiquinone/menaquinone biosynthesis C-methylase UbiE
MNYFATDTAAKHYQAGRPDFHSIAIERIGTFLGLAGKVDRALDVACGTGLSTKALLPIASNICGTDTSEDMLRLAYKAPHIQYAVAAAEQQPYLAQSFDLITVCSGVHWFDIDAFLLECKRLLRPGAWLVLYDNFFLGKMDGNPGFNDWYESRYLLKFPAPPRNSNYNWSKEQIADKGLDFAEEEQYSNPITFDKKGLIQYLITQSNLIAQVNNGHVSYDEAVAWLNIELNSFFFNESHCGEFLFGNWIKYIQKRDS